MAYTDTGFNKERLLGKLSNGSVMSTDALQHLALFKMTLQHRHNVKEMITSKQKWAYKHQSEICS